MTDIDIAAPAQEAPVAHENSEVQPIAEKPIHSEPVAPVEKVEVKKPPSVEESMRRAAEKVNAAEKAKTEGVIKPTGKEVVGQKPVVEAKAEAKADPVTDRPKYEAPQRWKAETKAKWDALQDDDIKGEVTRTVRELEQGYEKHRENATKWSDLKDFDEMAKAAGTDVKTALSNYTALERSLKSQNSQEKLSAIEEVFRVAKISPRDYAAHIMGQPVDQVASKTDNTIRELQETVRQLQSQTQQVTQTFEQQHQEQLESQLNEWAKDKPLAEQLAEPIAHYVNQGVSLDEAYKMAEEQLMTTLESLGFTKQQAQAQVAALPQEQPKPVYKSIKGAASAGSQAALRTPAKSPAEAVRRAMQAAGF